VESSASPSDPEVGVDGTASTAAEARLRLLVSEAADMAILNPKVACGRGEVLRGYDDGDLVAAGDVMWP
jgi:hypothetical protein